MKFDFANASGAQLDVSTALSAIGDLAVDLCFHVAHVCQRLEIERRLVNKRLSHFQKLSPESPASGNRPGLQQGQPLPGSHSGLIVTCESIEGIGHVSRIAFGAQSQIDAINIAFAGEVIQP
jgi:hypothetical protein